MANKPKEKGDGLVDQKKERKPESNCWMKKDLSSGLVEGMKKQPIPQEQQQGEKTEFQHEAKEREGTHTRNLSEVKSKQCHGEEPRKPCGSLREKSHVESHHVQKTSEPLREKGTNPLPEIIHSQNPVSKPQKEEQVSKEHPKSQEVRETKARDGSCSQTTRQSEPGHGPALGGPAARCAPLATVHSPGQRPEAASSCGDREENNAVFTSSKPPLFFDLTLDSQKEESLPFPGQSVQTKTSASGVSRRAESSDPAAQRVYLTTQLKQKKVITPDPPWPLCLRSEQWLVGATGKSTVSV